MYSPFSSELRRRHAPSPPKAQEEIVPRKNAQLETVREQKDEQEEQERTPGHDHHDPEKGHVQSPAEQNPSPGRMSTFGDGGIGLDFSFVESHNRLEDETMGTLTRLRKWFQKYFHLEQALHVQLDRLNEKDAPFHVRYRNWIALLAPVILIHTIWWSYMGASDSFGLFVETIDSSSDPRWTVALTMAFGSLVAGGTCHSSLAFPLLTMVLGVNSTVARDFSFLVQTVGMGAAAFAIWFMGVKVDTHAIVYCSIGGMAGVIFGLELVTPRLDSNYSEMYFVSIWFAFAFSLLLINLTQDQTRRFYRIPIWRRGELLRMPLFHIPRIGSSCGGGTGTPVELVLNVWICLLVVFGFLGGVFSAICGSGIDICCFALLTLYFRVTERVATPTAVVLMAINSLVAYTYTAAKLGVDAEVYRMWLVSIPIVAVGAPLGAIVSSHFHRYVLSALVYIVDAVQMTAALAIIQPWSTRRTDSPLDLCVDCGVILVSGSMFFAVLAKAGQQLQEYVQVGAEEEEGTPSSANSSPNTKIGMTDNPTLARKNADDAEETESDSGTPHNEADVDEHQLQIHDSDYDSAVVPVQSPGLGI